MAPRTKELYTLKNRQFKEKIIQAILSDPDVGNKADRAIDIIIQTPDEEIIPLIEKSFYANKTPAQLVNTIKQAESTIFQKYRVFPWEELHHETSLVSLRDLRKFSLEDQVKALNSITQTVGAPGNSKANLAKNSLDRRSHTSGMTIAKTQNGQRMSELFNLPSGEKQYSGHPFGTDARKDPSGIFVEAGSDVDNWINRAIESVNQQKEYAKNARRQSLPQRLVINNMLNTAAGAPTQSQLDIYSELATPEERQAALKFFKQPSSENFRISGVKAWTPFLSQAGQQRFQIPENAAWLESLPNKSDYLMRILPTPSMKDVKQNALGIGAGAVTGAITPESAYAAGKGDWRTAAVEGVKSAITGAVAGGATQAALTSLMPRVAAGLTSGPAAPLIAGVGAGLTIQDAAQAYRAGQSGRSIPLQSKVEQAQQDKRRQQDVAQFRAAMPGFASKNRMQANLSGNLSPQQIESFKAGGGNAAMMRDGLSTQQIIERGSALRLKQITDALGRTIRKEGDV